MAEFWTEVRRAMRTLVRSPGTTAVAIATLALGIGANTAIFSLLNAVVLRSLPVPHPEQLVGFGTSIADNVNGNEPFTLPMFDELARQQHLLTDVFAWNGGQMNTFEADGRYITASMAEVSGNYYHATGVAPLLGRYIVAGDVAVSGGKSNAVAVISYRAWRSWYHGAADIVGKVIRIGDHHPFTIIGVEPDEFSGMIIDGAPDVTVPIFSIPQATGAVDLHDRRILWLTLFGRMKAGVTLSQVRADIGLLWPRILDATQPPGYEGAKRARFFARRITVESAANGVSFLRKRFSYALRVLLAVVGALLLIACLNLANLALARASSRTHEAAIRTALGAGAWELMRQALIQALLLSFIGAALGLAIAYAGSKVLLQIAWTGFVATPLSTAPDWRVLVFTAAVAILSAAVFAAAPGWFMTRTDPQEALRQQTRSVRGGSMTAGKALLVAQVALSLMLVGGAALFVRTLNRLHDVDVGYKRDHMLTLMLFPQPGHRATPNSGEYYRQLAERMKQVPGVESSSFSGSAPASQFEGFEGVYTSEAASPVQAVNDFVAPDFFHVARMQVLSGREFTWQDDDKAPQVAIVSQSLARKLYGDADVVGRTLYAGPRAHALALRIVGVVNSASLWKVESVHPLAIYRPLSAFYSDADPMMDVRTTIDPRTVKIQAERVVRSFGRQYSLRTMTVNERLDSYLSVQRLTAMLGAFFGATALLIAAIGLYGLMSFHVNRRTAELGIRLALGARREHVLSMVLREVLFLTGAGCLLGVAGGLLSGQLIRSLLFGVSATDPLTFGFAVLILLTAGLVAGLVPALRAARVDPVTALRVE